MTTHSGGTRGVRSIRWPVVLPLVAAILAVLPLIASRIDGVADLDPFFGLLVAASLAVAGLLARVPVQRRARLAAVAIVVAWIGVAAWAAVLLVMYQTACACSMPDPATLPPAPSRQLATVLHVLATYGGAILVATAAFGRPSLAGIRR